MDTRTRRNGRLTCFLRKGPSGTPTMWCEPRFHYTINLESIHLRFGCVGVEKTFRCTTQGGTNGELQESRLTLVARDSASRSAFPVRRFQLVLGLWLARHNAARPVARCLRLA